MRVGLFIDGFNFYYGGRTQFGKGQQGWKWFSPRLVGEEILKELQNSSSVHFQTKQIWASATLHQTVLCSAQISGNRDQQAADDQNFFFRAVKDGNHADSLELGKYVARVKKAPLAVKGANGPEIYKHDWPIKVREDTLAAGVDSPVYMVSYFHSEEKGSDVNLATHLLKACFKSEIDAAIIISNDTDLKLPIEVARQQIPVGVVSPYSQVAGDLKKTPSNAVAGQWYFSCPKSVYINAQMPDVVAGKWRKPAGW